ncbi:MAG: hypothetical protein SGI74_08600 [Oligoflexia bacterium]|nr:hypothetical protein [Oligoflexia bacterium]
MACEQQQFTSRTIATVSASDSFTPTPQLWPDEKPYPAHLGSYDYGPTILFDTSDSKWKSWWCGTDNATGNRDSIWHSWTYDRINWSAPQEVFKSSGGASFDGYHVCDPSVLKNVAIGGTTYNYVMYYTGGPYSANTDNDGKIGIAVSSNGTSWTRLSGPLNLNCTSSSSLGCQHFRIIKIPNDRFVAVYTQVKNNSTDAVYNVESWDGVNWTGPNNEITPKRLCFENYQGGCHATPGVDIMYDPSGYQGYLFTFTAFGHEKLYKADATWFGTLGGNPTTLIADFWYPGPSGNGTFGPGFHRTENGFRPENQDIFSTTGNRNPHDFPQHEVELIQIRWTHLHINN